MAERKKTKLSIESILQSKINLASKLKKSVLEELGIEICEGFKKDRQSREDWEERSKEAMKLALQIAREKTTPWPGASNVKYPLLTISAIQFASRVELFETQDIVKVKIIGYDEDGAKRDRAIRVEKHMTYQLSDQMDGWDDDNDRMYHALPIIGSMFKKTYFNPEDGFNQSELIFPKDIVFDYWAPSIEKCMRKTHVIKKYPNQIEELMRAGIYRRVELDDDPPSTEYSTDMEDTVSEFEGRESYQDDDAARILLEQHCWKDFDGDGYQEPYCITVDSSTAEVLRIVPRFSEDSIIVDQKGKIIKIKPYEYFTQFTFIPDPNGGSLGVGFGNLQGPINEVVNSTINQLMDAGTLSIMGGGFIGKGLRTKAGNLDFEPGEWKFVQSTGDVIKDNIVPLPINQPSPVLFNLLGLLVEGGEKIGSITDALTGDNPPTNQPATTTLATIEQGLKVFKKIHKRLFKSFSKEFNKLFILNRRYLPDEEYFTVLDIPKNQLEKLQAGTQSMIRGSGSMLILRSDYHVDDATVIPSADPSVMTKVERMKKVEALLQSQQLLGWNPEVIKRRFVEAMEFTNPEELMQPPPPAPPDPKIQIEQMRLQWDQQKTQLEMQLEGLKLQMDRETQQAALQKTQMEIAKIEAEIRKMISEMNEDDSVEMSLEVEKLKAEYQIKLAELDIKRAEVDIKNREVGLKNKEIDTNRQTALDTDKNREAGENVKAVQTTLDDIKQSLDLVTGPKKIKRNSAGLIEEVGYMKIDRDEKGLANEITPTKTSEA